MFKNRYLLWATLGVLSGSGSALAAHSQDGPGMNGFSLVRPGLPSWEGRILNDGRFCGTLVQGDQPYYPEWAYCCDERNFMFSKWLKRGEHRFTRFQGSCRLHGLADGLVLSVTE